MKEEWLQTYGEMQKDIALCRQKGLDRRIEIECCYQISRNYWHKVQKDIDGYHFLSATEEIIFYKEIKPLFVSKIEYYNMLYHADLFKPVGDDQGIKEFWQRQGQRLEKFIKANEAFCRYYKSGDPSRDEEYFVIPASEDDGHILLHYDELIGQLLALEKYIEYVKKELACLGNI